VTGLFTGVNLKAKLVAFHKLLVEPKSVGSDLDRRRAVKRIGAGGGPMCTKVFFITPPTREHLVPIAEIGERADHFGTSLSGDQPAGMALLELSAWRDGSPGQRCMQRPNCRLLG